MNRALPLLLSISCVLGACATLPAGRSESALYVDVRKAVELRESTEWVVDRLEVEALAASAMRSACQVEAPARERLLTWLDAQIEAAGGPAEAAYRRDRDADIDTALSLERVRAVVRYADEHAHECPFWLSPDAAFAGVQTDAYRLVLLAESVGGGGLIVSGGRARLGGGGGGRLTLALGLDQRVTIGLGAELGGIGSFGNEDATGGRSLVARFTAAVPLLLRITNLSRLVDFELAATARWSSSDLRLPPGVRGAIGYGLTTVRVGPFMPTAVAYISYEYLPPGDGLGAEHLILLGTKVGLDFDP
jgi:hypothetical protein